MKTASQIADATEHLDGLANTRAINAAFRDQDESHLYPINGRFNATERAIRRTRKHFRDCGMACTGLEYCLALDGEISRIVNAVI